MNNAVKDISYYWSYEGDTIYESYIIENAECCICFENKPVITKYSENIALSLDDVDDYYFRNNLIPDDILIKCPCHVHFLCIECLRKIINDYENHPININNSHIYCPYPFESCINEHGNKYIFDHSLIKKICKTETEWTNYITYANQYSFTGFTIIQCPLYERQSRNPCNSSILVENQKINNSNIGELVLNCDQNPKCLQNFCYTCKQRKGYYDIVCYECKLNYENENPNMLNYYFNKMNEYDVNIAEKENLIYSFKEVDYLYRNNEITLDIAVQNITNLINDIHTYLICPICKVSIYKTEKCNALSHHSVERCYSCGRIGFKIRGLGDHWDSYGIGGCYRFDYDAFVKTHVPEYVCREHLCSNHERGDCLFPDHQDGIDKLNHMRKKACVYHALKSLIPSIRYDVYDKLYNDNINTEDFIDFLPYKQTLYIIEQYKARNKDYIEDIVYSYLQCENPSNINEYKSDKSYILPVNEYVTKYYIGSTQLTTYSSTSYYNTENTTYNLDSVDLSDVSAWRAILNNELRSYLTPPMPAITTNHFRHDVTEQVPLISFRGYTLLADETGNDSDTTMVDLETVHSDEE